MIKSVFLQLQTTVSYNPSEVVSLCKAIRFLFSHSVFQKCISLLVNYLHYCKNVRIPISIKCQHHAIAENVILAFCCYA